MGRTKGSGAGSVYKRGDKWRGQIIINGKRLSYTAEKQKDVFDWIASVRTGETIIADKEYTVQEWVEIFFEKRYKLRVSENTYLKNSRLVRNHLYPQLGDILLKDLSANIIQEAYPKMFDTKKSKKYRNCQYSDGTIKIFSSVFNQALVYGVNEGVIRKNPYTDVIVPKTGIVKQVEAYTAEEQQKIIEYTKNKTDINRIYYFLLATGMRVGELIALTWDDIDLKEGSINITKTAINKNGHMEIQDHPKTAQSVRKIYMSNNTRVIMRKIKETKLADKIVFPNEHGNIYHTSALWSRWQKVCAEIGIPYKNLHALRHSWATRALEKHVEVHTVSKILGHKSVATTMDIYQSIFAEQKKEAAKIMNDIL